MPLSFVSRLSLIAAACSVLAACSTFNNATSRISGLVTPYKVEVVQGNFVSKEQREALQAGMPRAQVRDILGSPLVTSAFHTDRWDYAFTIRRQGQEPQLRKLTVFFKGDELLKVESDDMPTEQEFVSSLSEGRKLGKVPLLEVPPEVLREFGLAAAAQNTAQNSASAGTNTAPSAPVSVASSRNYPPLEAPGAVTSAWDASTQRAVAASVSARPSASAGVGAGVSAPISAAAQAPVLTSQAPLLAPAAPTAVARPAPATTATAPSAPPAPSAPTASAAPSASSAPAAPAVASAPASPVAAAPTPAAAPARPSAAVTAAPAVPSSGSAPAATTPITAPTAAPATSPATPALAPRVAAAPAVAAPPPPPPAPSASTLANADPAITSFLNAWTSDWQSRNASAYFAHYVPEFKGTSETRAEWEALRRSRIEGRSRISLAVLDVRVRMVSPTEARLVFRQDYDSDAYKEVGTKAMFLIKREGRWFVEREFFTPIN